MCPFFSHMLTCSTYWDHLWVSPTGRTRLWLGTCHVDAQDQQCRAGWSSSCISGLLGQYQGARHQADAVLQGRTLLRLPFAKW